VGIANFTSCGVALSTNIATGKPCRSATAMIFVPLPRFVFPTFEPLFSWGEAPVDESFFHVEYTAGFEILGQGFQNSPHHSGTNPLLKASVAGLKGRIPLRELGPWGTGSQYPQNTVQHGPAAFPRPSSTILSLFRLRDERVENCPLGVGQVFCFRTHNFRWCTGRSLNRVGLRLPANAVNEK
jgi:hypothetical protein